MNAQDLQDLARSDSELSTMARNSILSHSDEILESFSLLPDACLERLGSLKGVGGFRVYTIIDFAGRHGLIDWRRLGRGQMGVAEQRELERQRLVNKKVRLGEKVNEMIGSMMEIERTLSTWNLDQVKQPCTEESR